MSDQAKPTIQRPPPKRWRSPNPGSIVLRLLTALFLIVVVGFVYIDRHAPLNPSAPPNIVTGLQLQLMRAFPERCVAALARADNLSFALSPRPIDNGCGYPDGISISRSGVSYGGAVVLRCPAAVALVMWERHVLQPEAQRVFGKRVASVETYGTYSCRNVYNRENARRSQHATANAIDVAGITLQGGPAITVRRGWESGEQGRFLRAIRDGACGLFRVVLSPDYNRAHADHLHLDMGRWMACR
jgi:hypothetical protein